MNIIDHLSVGVPDIGTGQKFYDPVMSAMGASALAVTEGFAAYGNGSVQFLIMKPQDGNAYTAGNGTPICFVASSQEVVDNFYRAALENGGTDNGEPGPRPGYPKPDVYTAFVIDPFGNKLEIIHNGFNG